MIDKLLVIRENKLYFSDIFASFNVESEIWTVWANKFKKK